jgi:hypothetical protein
LPRLVEQVGHDGQEPGEDQADGESVLDEVLDVGGESGKSAAVSGMDLVDRDDKSVPALVQ